MQVRGKKVYALFLMFLLLQWANAVVAQEICSNGKDDDSDGLADLRDPDCQCRFKVTGNLLQNPSFESYNRCPVTYLYDQEYNIADYWQFGTYVNQNEAFFFHHLNCVADSENIMRHMPPKLPLPEGKGFISIIKYAYVNPAVPESDMTKSYVAQCLPAPLKSGVNYTLSFYGGRFVSWDNPTRKLYPFDVAVFGNADCNAVPFGKKNAYGNGCPSNYPGWVMLGKTTVNSDGEWVQAKINFTPAYDINVIEIGPDCRILEPIIIFVDSTTFLDYYQYFLDDMHLLPTKDFPFEYIYPKAGSYCSDRPVLVAPVVKNAGYQWFRDSVAIPGATDSIYVVQDDKTSFYNVGITTDSGCVISEPYLVAPGRLNEIKIPADTVLCSESNALLLSPAIDGISYTINGIASNAVIINNEGTYNIFARDATGCQKVFRVNVARVSCEGCHETMPAAFTPNGDGLNDIFRPKFNCAVSSAVLVIYNRWGQKLFESRDVNRGWGGTWNGVQQPAGTYTYVLQYKTFNNTAKAASGVVVLIR